MYSKRGTSLFFLLAAFSLVGTSHLLAQDPFDPGTAGASCTVGCVTTYHNDNARTGVFPYETLLTPSYIASSSFGLKKTISGFDSLIYAQPLFVSGLATNKISGCSNATQIVIVATLNNTVYAVDVTSGSATQWSICWHTSLNSTQFTDYPIPFTDLTYDTVNQAACNNLLPQGGITGTPVIDVGVNPPAIYTVSGHKTPNNSTVYDYQLNILRMDTGAQVKSIGITPYISGFNALYENQRAGLAMYKPSSGGYVNLYVGFSSHCDYVPAPTSGYMQGYVAGFKVTYSGGSVTSLGSFTTEANSKTLGGIWSVGAAPPVDASGNIYFSVGNGDWNGAANSGGAVPTDLGDSVIQMSPSLAVTDYYTPNVYSYLETGSNLVDICFVNTSGSCPSSQTNGIPTQAPLAVGGDFDLGSGGVTLITPYPATYNPCGTNAELIAAGKEGVIYGVCYKPGASSGANVMGGLDGCGYNPTSTCLSNVNTAAQGTACTQSGTGAIAQCFAGPINTGTAGKASGGSHSSEAFWSGSGLNNNNVIENYLYMVGSGDQMKAFQLTSAGQFNVNYPATAAHPTIYGGPGPTPVVSWNGQHDTTGASAIVWAVDSSQYGRWIEPPGQTAYTSPAGAATLYGYAAVPTGTNCSTSSCTLTKEFESDLLSATPNGPGAVKFTVPTVANGMVFVAGGTGPTTNGTKTGYAPGTTGATNVTCSPTATGGSCAGYLFVYSTVP